MNMAEPLAFRNLRGELRRDEPMGRHVTWRTGGSADRFYRPADLDDLAAFLRQLPPQEPLLFVGLGSNLLVRDGGIPAAPGWQAQPVALEDLVLAYLRGPSEPSAAVTSGVAA